MSDEGAVFTMIGRAQWESWELHVSAGGGEA